MGGPGATSADIVGVEIGRFALRGVRLDQNIAQVTSWAECFYSVDAVGSSGIIDPMIFGPRLDELLDRLGVADRASVRVGFTIGPRHAGVGSGPALSDWLVGQAAKLSQQMTRAGELGVSFAPSRAVDAAVKLASGAGLDLVRVDLAPVAAARAIGSQVDDLICVGSGQGWQARMRDFEVLEAMENTRVDADRPLTIYGADGVARTIDRYGWVELQPGLLERHPLHVGQMATAVGAAVGVLYESPGNLLNGETVGGGAELPGQVPIEPVVGSPALESVDLSGDGAEATLRLQRVEADGAPTPQPARREVRHAPTKPAIERSPVQKPSVQQPAIEKPSVQQPAIEKASAEQPSVEKAPAPPPAVRPAKDRPPQRQANWADDYDERETDPITMFSPDTEVEEMMGKRNRRLSVDILLALVLLAAVGAVVYYLFLA